MKESSGAGILGSTGAQLAHRLRSTLTLEEDPPAVEGQKHAAVALILAGDELSVLAILRSTNPNDPWSGHMALPGGRHEQNDPDLIATARRETMEEVGVDLSGSELLGMLPRARARSGQGVSNLTVSPFVFRAPGPLPPTRPNREVEKVLWIPLAHLRDPNVSSEVTLERGNSILKLPAWRIQEQTIWGLTHGILLSLLRELESLK